MRILALIWKELLATFQDPRSRLSILLPPFIQLILFTSAATLDVKNVPIGILNRDSGKEGFELTERFHGTPFFSKIRYLKGIEDIAPFIDKQEGVMVVSIDEQFSRNLKEKGSADIQLILDGRKSNTAQILASYTTNIVQQFNLDFAKPVKPKAQIVQRFWYNPNALYPWYNTPSLVCTLTMLACLVVTTQSVARERELGTFDQLLVSPLVPFDILVGKVVPGIMVGIVQGFMMLILGSFIFQVPFVGSITLFLLSQLVFTFAISGIGLFISSLSATQQQAMLGTFIFMLPAVLLSGFATPIENMPYWLQQATYVNPLRYMLVNTKGVFLKEMPAHMVLANIWPMLLIGIFNQFAASYLFRKRFQ